MLTLLNKVIVYDIDQSYKSNKIYKYRIKNIEVYILDSQLDHHLSCSYCKSHHQHKDHCSYNHSGCYHYLNNPKNKELVKNIQYGVLHTNVYNATSHLLHNYRKSHQQKTLISYNHTIPIIIFIT